MSVYQLLYFSRSNISSREDLDQLALQSANNNSRLGVTGLLIFQDGFFLQLLEGERAAVHDLFDAHIKKDPRHTNVVRLLFQESDDRLFPNWSMKFQTVRSSDLNFAAEILLWQNDLASTSVVDRHQLSDLFKRVLET